MRRAALVTAVLVLAAGLAGCVAPGGPGEPPAPIVLAGTFDATGDIGGPCSGAVDDLHQSVHMTSNDLTPIGPANIDLDFCITPVSGDEFRVYDGLFELGTADGALSGELTGTVLAGGPGPRFPFTFTGGVNAASGDLTGYRGPIIFEGSFGIAALDAEGTISGTLEYRPCVPSKKDACKKPAAPSPESVSNDGADPHALHVYGL